MAKYFSYQEQYIGVGDTVRVHQEITEGSKKRIQVFEGIVIAIKNRGLGQSFTVRKIASNGIGVEKIYPVHMPGIKKIEIKSKGNVRRSKLYYLRDRVGKRASKVKEQSQSALKKAEATVQKLKAKQASKKDEVTTQEADKKTTQASKK